MIYLDNAATSFPKPTEVYTAAEHALRELGGNPSRSGHIMSEKSGNEVYECREALSRMFSAKPENIVFTLNATHALNLAIKGTSVEGAHYIISNMEHNAVLRPLTRLCEEKGCSYDIIDVLDKKSADLLRDIKKKIRANTRALIMNHCSNLCSNRIYPRRIGELCEKEGIIFILDASQSAGHIAIDIDKEKINILCAPAHKGMLGIMGGGFLISDGKYTLDTLLEGGSGFNSTDIHMPALLPERLEAGTLPTPAIASLRAGCEFIEKTGISQIRSHENMLFCDMVNKLSEIKQVKIYRPGSIGSCLLFNVKGLRSDMVGEYLAEREICVRSGFHCAPLAHKSLCTGEYGAVRVSYGFFNSVKDNEALYFAIKDLIRLSGARERR